MKLLGVSKVWSVYNLDLDCSFSNVKQCSYVTSKYGGKTICVLLCGSVSFLLLFFLQLFYYHPICGHNDYKPKYVRKKTAAPQAPL